MYQPGDLIVYGLTGVCRVEDVTRPGIAAMDPDRDYYVLRPLYQDGIVYTPVDQTQTPIRPVMTRDEADALIDAIPRLEQEPAEPLPPGDPSREYSRRLKTQNCREWMVLTLEIYRKSQLAKEKKRRLGSVDERTWKQAELLLHGELATALGLTLEELPGYIARRLENN